MSRVLLLIALGCAVSGCHQHELDDGLYQFTVSQVLRDDCELAGVSGVVGTGGLKTTGNIVAFDYSYLDLQLVGTYLSGVEQMTLDGTAVNLTTQVRGRECLLDTVAVHVDAVSRSPTKFDGSMSIVFDARQPDSCVCKFWFTYVAQRTGAAP